LHNPSASNDLMTLAQARPEDRDGTLLRAATALFCQEPIHDRDAIRRYEQLAIHLLPKIAPNDRAYVASLLGGRSDAPPSVLRLLARDAIGIAGPVLRQSPVLSTIDLLGVIAVTGQDHHRLITGRTDLNADVLRALAIARQKYAPADESEAAVQAETNLPSADATDSTFAMPPSPVPTPSFADFLGAPRERRLRILGEASSRRWRAHKGTQSSRLDHMLSRSYATAEIVARARKHDRAGLVEAFAASLGISSDVAARLLHDPSGEPLVLMIRASGLSDADGRTVLLLANKEIGESVDAFFRLADLYASLETATAEAFIAAWRQPSQERRPTHVPVFTEATDRPAAAASHADAEQPQQRRAGES
jgi:hypothetical protein